jgi:hypothetical protein
LLSRQDLQRQKPMLQRKVTLALLFIAVVASFFAYARHPRDFANYVAVGNAVLHRGDIYLDTQNTIPTTMPPCFGLAAVPLALLDKISPYFARIVWIALTWASIVWALHLLAGMIYGKRLKWRADESSLDVTSPELLIPFLLTLPYFINDMDLLQINAILFALALWGLYLQERGRESAGGIAIGAAAALKIMAVAFLPYLLYRKRWRAALWMAAATIVFFLSPVLVFGWAKFTKDLALWPVFLRSSWGAGNAQQSVYSMWDRILGYGYMPFAVPGTFILPLSGAHSVKLAWEITCVILAALGLVVCRGIPPRGSRWVYLEWALVFVAVTILSPVTRKPYLVVLLLPYALLYAAWRSTDLDMRTRRILRDVMFVSFALSIPTMHDVIGTSLAVRLEMGSVVTYGSLIMLGGLLWYRSRAQQLGLAFGAENRE